jgi:hypothetical protein
MPARSPDWDHWLQLRTVKLWQACALSVCIEPNDLERGPSLGLPDTWWRSKPPDGVPPFQDGSFPTPRDQDGFYKRLQIVLSYIDDPSLPLSSHDQRDWIDYNVGLPEFARWAVRVARWWLPAELIDLAGPEGSVVATDRGQPRRATREEARSNESEAVLPLQRQCSQENEILSVITELLYDPVALPKGESGKPGVKAKVREQLLTDSRWTTSIFDKAWQRLRDQKRIKNVN